MEKREIGKNLHNMYRGAMESVKTAAKDVKLPEIKAPELSIPSQVKDVFKRKESEQVPVVDQTDTLVIKSLSTKSAIKIIYYLMAVDGEVYHSEEEKFDSICVELDPDFAENREQIIRECREQMEKVIDPDDYYDVVQDGVEDALISSLMTENTVLTPKLFVWNLLSVAYSDDNYNDTERKLIKYLVRKLDIDKAEYLEMESSFLTLIDLDRGLNWIKTTSRPYLTMETMVNEIEKRKSVIFESVKVLISL